MFRLCKPNIQKDIIITIDYAEEIKIRRVVGYVRNMQDTMCRRQQMDISGNFFFVVVY